jgi:hypothetical protein
MSAYDESLLAARFAALAPEPLPEDWADVLRRSGVAQQKPWRLGRFGALGGRRRRLVVLAVAALVVIIGTASAIGSVRDFILDKGFIGLAPLGATPSTPESGELEIFYWVERGAPGEVQEGRSRNWVYADGRLISDRSSSGLLEQRLSPEGLELLRSEILSTGQFSHEPPPPPPPPPCPKGESSGDNGCAPPQPLPPPGEPLETPFGITIAVRDVGRLSRVDRASDLYRLEERLTDPASWLPASAWVDREIRAYVPSTYAVCYGGWPPDQPIEPSRLLTLLPPAAEDLLGAKDTTRKEGLFGSPGDFHVVVDHCSDVTNEEAHMLAQVFDDAGFEPFMPASRLGYRFETPGSNEKNAQIYFEPYLPHGEVTCSVCG